MRIAVTGASGFVGAFTVEHLVARGHDVAVLLRPGTSHWRLEGILDRVTVVEGSLDRIQDLRPRLAQFQPDTLLHLAWRGVSNQERNSPVQARNVVDIVDLVGLCGELGIKTFIGAGSQAEYGPYERAILEQDVTRPTTLYGKAKVAACEMAGQIAAASGMRFAWLRIFSTYGPKHEDFWIFPSVIRTLRSGQRMPLTAGEQLWGFLHVRDAAAGIRTVVEDEKARGIFNLGSPDAPRLKDTIIMLRDLVNPSAELGFGDVPYRSDQVMVLKADISRLAALGWKPAIDLACGLKEMAVWYA
jgi:UDP-glucose 4-epimerase